MNAIAKIDTPPMVVRILLTFAMAMVAFVGLSLAQAQPSHAADVVNCSTMSCAVNQGLNLTVHNASAGGGVIGNGSAGGSSKPPVPVCMAPPAQTTLPGWQTIPKPGCVPQWVASTHTYATPNAATLPAGAYWTCPATKVVNGVVVGLRAVVFVNLKSNPYWTIDAPNKLVYWSYSKQSSTQTCVYPTVSGSGGKIKNCIISWNSTLNRLSASYAGAKNGVTPPVNGTTAWGSEYNAGKRGEQIGAACETSKSVNFNHNRVNKQADWGQYNVVSSIVYAQCTPRTVKFEGSSSVLADCSKKSISKTDAFTMYCGGGLKGHRLFTWTADDCPEFTCKPGPSTFNGKVGTVQTIRDGGGNDMTWGKPVFTGNVWGQHNWRSKVTVLPGSSPMNPSYGLNDKNKQLFATNYPFGSWNAGQGLDQKLYYYAAGDSGAPFKMEKRYLYDATFLFSSAQITNYDIFGSGIKWNNGGVAFLAVNNSCKVQSSPNINVIRAIGDVVR